MLVIFCHKVFREGELVRNNQKIVFKGEVPPGSLPNIAALSSVVLSCLRLRQALLRDFRSPFAASLNALAVFSERRPLLAESC